MGRGHTIPDQPHPSHPAQKGEIIRRSAEPKHLKEADKPKAPKSILTAATVAASAGALIMTATPALAEESASETAPAKDTAQTETARSPHLKPRLRRIQLRPRRLPPRPSLPSRHSMRQRQRTTRQQQMLPPRSRTSRMPRPRKTRTPTTPLPKTSRRPPMTSRRHRLTTIPRRQSTMP